MAMYDQIFQKVTILFRSKLFYLNRKGVDFGQMAMK